MSMICVASRQRPSLPPLLDLDLVDDHVTFCHGRCARARPFARAVRVHTYLHPPFRLLQFRKHVVLYFPIRPPTPDHHGYARMVHPCEQQLTGVRSNLPLSCLNYPTFASPLEELFPKSTKLRPLIHLLRTSQCWSNIIQFRY